MKKEAEKQFKGELLRTFFKKLSNYSEEVCVFFQLTQNIYRRIQAADLRERCENNPNFAL